MKTEEQLHQRIANLESVISRMQKVGKRHVFPDELVVGQLIYIERAGVYGLDGPYAVDKVLPDGIRVHCLEKPSNRWMISNDSWLWS
jgi:hypothetical protein